MTREATPISEAPSNIRGRAANDPMLTQGDIDALATASPAASRVEVLEASTGRSLAVLREAHPAGVFEGAVPRRKNRFAYKLRVTWDGTP